MQSCHLGLLTHTCLPGPAFLQGLKLSTVRGKHEPLWSWGSGWTPYSLLWVHGRREWVTQWGPDTNSTAWAATPGQRPAYWGGGLPGLTFNPHSQGSWPRTGLISWEAPPSHPGRVSCSALLRAQGPLCLQSPLPPLLLRPCPSPHVLSRATSSGPLQTTLISADPFLISLPPCIPESHGVPAGPHHWCANPAHALAERDQRDQAWAVPDRSRSWAPSLTWAGPAQLLTCSPVPPMCSGSSGFWWVSSLSPCQPIPLGTAGLWGQDSLLVTGTFELERDPVFSRTEKNIGFHPSTQMHGAPTKCWTLWLYSGHNTGSIISVQL